MSCISLQYQQLNRLFPFFVLVNEQMQVQRCGESIQKLIDLQEGNPFFGAFTVTRPFIKNNSAASLHQICNQVVILSTNKLNVKLKGQFEYLADTNSFLFLSSPWFNSIDEVVGHQLTVNDFAHHDTIIDLLHILKEYESTNIEIKQLLKKVNEQSTELKKLSLIAEEINNGIIITNKYGKVEWVNKAFEKISGYLLAEVLGKTPGSVLQGDETNPETVAFIRQKIKAEQPFECELVNYNKNGNSYWTKISGQPILDKSGKLVQFFALQEDITEKKNAQHALETQRQFYEDVLNSIPADIAVFSNKHVYLFVNPVAIKSPEIRQWIVGKTDEDFCEYRNRPLQLAADRRKLFNSVAEAKKQKEWEETIKAPDGSLEYFLRKMCPVLDENGEVKLVIGYGLNITERKKAEEQTKLSEKRYRDLFNFSQALICTHDLAGKMISVNPAICQTLGYSEAELVGKNLIEFIPDNNKPKFNTDYLNHVIDNGKYSGVFSVINKKGDKIFLLYQNFKVEEYGEETYIIGFSQDITERIRAEKELTIAKQAAEDAGKAKQVFLANMSHEIRTPMTGILGIAELLSKTNQTPQQKEFTHLIIDSTNTLLHIINDVLDIAKIEAGKFDLEEIPFKVVEKVRNVVKSFVFKADEKGVLLQFKNNVDPNFVVAGDPHRLIQVLNNLINNAIKFTKEGKITVTLNAFPPQDNRVTLQFTVTDTGIGISPENQQKIFDAFVQASADTTRKFGGTGLGLSICKQLIEQQGGNIYVESVVSRGSSFVFSIPYVKADPVSIIEEVAINQQISHNNTKKILVAEDVLLNQIIAKNILESWGHTVEIAGNGVEALAKATVNDYDLILMDVHMPEMDGLIATQRIRKLNNARRAQVPIIALTASAFKNDTQRFLDAGMNSYVTKPYTQQKLYASIGQILNASHVSLQSSNLTKETLASSHQTEPPLYDLAQIIELDDDATFVARMVEVFKAQVAQEIVELATAVAEKNWINIYKISHKLKPSINTFNIHSCAEVVSKLEAFARAEKNYDDITSLFSILQSTLQKVIVQLEAEFPE